MSCRYFYKGNYYTEEQLSNLPEFKIAYTERDLVNNNTDIKTDNSINLFSPNNANLGVFTKFVQFKMSQLTEYRRRLRDIEKEKKRKDTTAQRLTELTKLEKELTYQIQGKFELGITGLIDEINELKQLADINAIGYYANKDLDRLQKLVDSDNIDDLVEAQRLIDFYDLAGTFKIGTENPFFAQDEIFLEDQNGNLTAQYKLPDATMDQFIEWKNKALSFQNIINKRKEETTVNIINSDPSVIKTYGNRNFTFKGITHDETGLKDTDWVSMWTMDITQGIFSNNGMIPQVMFSYLTNSLEKKLAWSRQIEERIDKLSPEVEKELRRLGFSLRGAGIFGLKGASYQIFKEITREGNETGGLVQRFVREFFDSQSGALNKFNNDFASAKLYADYTTRAKAYNKAFEELKKWRRNNTIIFDINKIPELTSSTPTTEAYKKSLVDILGDKGYNEQLEKQKKALDKYNSERLSMIDTLLVMEGVPDYASLSPKAKSDLAYWENNHDPKKGIEDYFSVRGLFFGGRKANNFMDYNTFVPRKFKANITSANGEYVFTDTPDLTGHYSTSFKTIEDNPILNEFYTVIKEVCDTVRENMPIELQMGIAANTMPGVRKSFVEIVADKNIGILKTVVPAFKHLLEKLRLSFGVMKQSELSYATLDPITGKSNYKVNDQFMQSNARAVKERMVIEKARFLQAFNVGGNTVQQIRRFSVLHISRFSPSSLLLLASYINVDISIADIQAGRLNTITDVTGENVQIGKYIRDFSLNSVVQSQSFDLAKVGKYLSNMTMMYAARQEALPILNIMKEHYESIQKPKTNNLGTGIYNVNNEVYEMSGVRTNAIRQMDDWFERVALDNYGNKHAGVHGMEVIETIDPQTKKVKTNIPLYGKKIYSVEEKKKIKEIDKILSDAKGNDPYGLRALKKDWGKERTATALFDNLLAWIRTLRLGYNLSSASTNFLEGVTSNMILAAQNEFFDPKEIFYGYGVVKHSFLKNITFGWGTTGLAKRNRKLMDKFNVIMDSKNELQKSSVKTYANKFSWLNPHALNQRVEYINQSPILIAMLRTLKIKDKTGVESKLWNAFNNDGHLKNEFRTPENIVNWEDLTGEDYLAFKQKLHKAIVLGHGNYDELRGMMIKSASAGKALMLFKTWIPMQFYWRFATEQDDIQSGTIAFKGRYWSYSRGTGSVYGAAIGTGLFGPLGTVIGGALGYYLGSDSGKRAVGGLFHIDVPSADPGVGLLKETLEATKALTKKVYGMPVNFLSSIILGKGIVDTGDKAFESWVGKGSFTQQDARNMRANIADISMQLAWLALILAAKAMLWDDDDEPESPERIAHNISVNKLMQLSSQGAMYVNPVDAFKSVIQTNGVWQYLLDVGKEVTRVSEALHGRDIIQSGINAGESGLANQTSKIVMPGLFKGNLFGFESQAEKVFEESPFHPYFKSEQKADQEDNKRERAARKIELEEQLNIEDFDDPKERDKEIRRILDEELPTPSKLKKMEMTREEYETERKEEQ